MSTASHIPQLQTITDFYKQLNIGLPQSDDFAIMRIEDQPETKRLEMPLFRCDFFRVVFFINAGVAFRLGEESLNSTANSIYFSYPGKLESWNTSQKIHGYLVCFTEAFARIDSGSASFSQLFPFFRFEGDSLLSLSDDQANTLKPLTEEMLTELKSANTDRHDMIRLLLHQYLLKLKRMYTLSQERLSPMARNSTLIFNSFRQALDRHLAALAQGEAGLLPSVSLIAHEINLNASYLNTTIKELTGKTASSYIRQKILLEIKSYLIHTDLQMAQISHQLGFTNVSYFNRFFKNATGITPSQFQKSQYQP